VGLQAHVYDLDTDTISTGELTDTIDGFAAAGLRVRISENDVTDDGGTRAQADQYAAVLSACLARANCVSYTTWGVDDRYDWFVDDDGSLQQGHDLLFDDGRPTDAYEALRAVLGG
jgi:endo-1,4-beta-xylanase